MPSSSRSGPPPNHAVLHQAALAHLARFSVTRAGLCRVLDRRVERWARHAQAARAPEEIAECIAVAKRVVREVVAGLVASGVVDDAAFAAARARRLQRAGRSCRGLAAHLAAKGVDAATASAALPRDEGAEVAAALVLARRRRIGPFRAGQPPDDAGARRELGILARAGYPRHVAARALAMHQAEAEEQVRRLLRD